MPQKMNEDKQYLKFKESARTLSCDENETRFNQALAGIVKPVVKVLEPAPKKEKEAK